MRYPNADILGIDSSENMITEARRAYPAENWRVCKVPDDLPSLAGNYDLIFSNACIQWIPDHAALIPAFLDLLAPKGILAVQVPMNFHEPVHQIIESVIRSPEWDQLLPEKRIFYTLRPEEYYVLLSGLSEDFSIWQTTYYHVMGSVEDIMDWYRGTGLLPYLRQLPSSLHVPFEQAIRVLLQKSYPPQKDGKVIFRFPRFFFTITKK